MEWPRDDRGYAAAYRARRFQPGGWYPPGWGGGAVHGLAGGGPYPYHPFAGYGGDFSYGGEFAYGRDFRANRDAPRRTGYGREFAPRDPYGREFGRPGEEAFWRGGRRRGYDAVYDTGRLRRDAGPPRGDWRRRGY
jgi:hypothetical protein